MCIIYCYLRFRLSSSTIADDMIASNNTKCAYTINKGILVRQMSNPHCSAPRHVHLLHWPTSRPIPLQHSCCSNNCIAFLMRFGMEILQRGVDMIVHRFSQVA